MVPYESIQSLHIEASSHCNAACPVCPRNYHGGPTYPWFEKRFLTLADHQKFFPPDFASRQRLVLYCGNYGDPSLNPELVDICAWWFKQNPHVAIQINTNAGTRDAEFWSALGRVFKGTYGNVTFSVDGLADTNHLYRRKVEWDKVMTAMESFIGAGGTAVWEFLVFQHNQHQVEEARALSKKLGFKEFHPKKAMGFSHQSAMPVLNKDAQLERYLYPPDEGGYRNQAALGKDEVIMWVPDKNYLHQRNDAPADWSTYMLEPRDEKRFDGCGIACRAKIDRQLFIGADGNLYPCCFIGSRDYATNLYSFLNKQIQEFLAANGRERLSLHHRSLKEIVEDKVLNESYEASWRASGVRQGKLAVCSEFCGTGVNELNEATSHRPRLGDS